MIEGATIDDPFGAKHRVDTDEKGLRTIDRDLVEPGVVVFHTVVGNHILAIDIDGRVCLKFDKPPKGYRYYRPGKAGSGCSIFCILKSKQKFEDRVIAEIDSKGEFIWKTKHHHFTHDYQIRGNTIVTVFRRDAEYQGKKISNNVLCEMSRGGEVRWEWSVLDNLDQFRNASVLSDLIKKYEFDNPFHINSVDLCDWPVVVKKFEEPVIVVSSRSMNCVFCVGRWTEKVRYEYSGETMGQHHARILPDMYPGSEGNLLIVDNGVNFMPPNVLKTRGYSRIIEVDMSSDEIVWEYSGKNDGVTRFFSPIVGAQQRFPGGNTLITEGYFGRIFEIDRSGKIVWDYVHPNSVPYEEHIKKNKLHKTGLRQIYRAYKVGHGWLDYS